ncbi:MAG: heparinase II/III family protein [Bacteroidales bacterium]|nr:heparinase II/III family protein [Bacteroidales bacterium]
MKKLVVYILFLVSPVLSAQEKFDISGHPRLLLTAGEEDGISRMIAADPAMAKVHDGIVAECDRMLALPPLERVMEGKRLLHTSREALRRIFWLSYSYRMTGKEAYAERAIDEMMAVCAFKDWNPSHFLDVGEMVMAVAIGYDWLYDVMLPEQRQTVSRSIMEKGFEPADDERYSGFYNLANNWNQVCCSGLMYGALATYEDHPEYSRELIDLYVRSVPFALACYAPDGGYPEGFNYWGYGTSFQVMMIAALESALGTDYGLSEAPGFLDTGSFIQFMTAPSGDCFNFSDSPSMAACNPMMFWFAGRNDDPSIIFLERRVIRSLPDDFMKDASRRFTEYRLLPSLLIFASRLDTSGIAAPEENFRVFEGKTPLFVYREGWESEKDAYLGIKGGSPMTSHAHMDAGSFIYEYDGVRWSMDLGMQDYHSLESRGVDLWNQEQHGQRWDVFRLGNEAHSTLTLNGDRHRVKSFVPLTGIWQKKSRKGACLEMTEAFGDMVTDAERSVFLDRRNRLHVEDRLTADDGEVEVMWVMTTPARARIAADGSILLEKDGKRMKLRMTVSSDDASYTAVNAHVWSNDPPHDYDAPNPGTCRVGFTFTVPANCSATASATLRPF